MRNALRALVLAGVLIPAWPALAQAAQIISAEFILPVDRYHHDILGDTPEWGGMKLRLAGGRHVTITLPDNKIFEDIAPRLVDVDGDGTPEVIAVETSMSLGARLTVWDETGVVAATPNIGRRNRWLAPIGAADLDGDGKVEIAYVDRPHLARLLRIWRFDQGRLSLVAEQAGLTNHRIGDNQIFSGLRECDGDWEMVMLDREWSRLIGARLRDGKISTRDLGPYSTPSHLRTAVACN
jgi:hypothetical protein